MGLELHIYDFDGTLFRSPEKPEGWDNRWWISSESLNPPCVPLDPSGEWWISKTVSAARASIANPDTYAVMMTGRPVRSGFRYRVPELLKSVGLKFDEVHLSDTNNTPAFKIKVIKNLLRKFPGVEKIVFWDDNAPYMARYVKLVEGYGYQAEANLVTVPAMECDEVPAMGEGPFRKEASEQIEVMKFLSAVARNAGIAEHVYVVGGAVRNFIIGQPIKDVDVVIDSVALRGRDSAWFARKIADSLPCESSLVTNNYGVAILTIKGPWILNGHDLSGEVIEIANARKESYGGEAGKGYKPNMVEPATIQEDVVRREFTFNCMAGDTLIPTERGILRIDEIASREDGVQQNINLKVAGQDGPATAVGWQYSGFAPTLRVTTEWGHSFACTHHHPVLVLRGCRHEWVQADQLGEGDLLCVPVRQVVRQTPLVLELPDPVQPKRGTLKEVIKPAVMTPELAFVIGCVVAEGSNTHKRVSFSNSDPALISRYVECFQAVFGFQPSRNKVVEKGSVRILRGVEFVANKDGYDIYADSKAVVGWLEDLGLYCGGSKNDRSASHYKVVPWSILQADEQSQSAFLAAYLEGDGSIRPDSGRMVFRSVSPHIRQQLQVLLGAHGVLGKVEGEFVYVNAVDAAVLWSKIHPWMVTKTFDYTSRKFKSRNRYGIPADYIKGFVAGRKQDANQSVYVTDGGASRTLFGVYEPVRKIQRLLHDAHARGDFDGFMASLKVISPDEHANLQRLFDLGYQYVGVTSVEDAGEQDVFDISMNEGVEPAFVANGVVVHNTLLWRLHDLADGPDKAEIIDLSGCGLKDLQSGTMRCPNDPDIIFSDDPSRMIRAIKFLLKYGFRIDPEVAASIKRNAGKLKKMPAAHLSTMLVETFFEPGVGKKALLEMDKLGLLDVVREIAQENKPFRAALDNWANKRSGLEFLFDLLDLQMPMGKRLSVVPQDLLPQFRAYSEAEPDKAVALLEVLDQPGRKFDMPRLIRELGISGAEIKDVTNTIRRLLVLNPDLTEADLYRKLIQGRAIRTAAISDKHIDFNLARKGSGMNKVAQIERVAARPITPEKLKELMLKVRKGSTASLNIKQVQAVIEAIGGKITPSVVLASPAYPLNIFGNLDKINREFPLYKSKLVPRLPSNPKIGEMYVTKVENPTPPDTGHNDVKYSSFIVHYYRGVEEFTIKIPKNDDVKVSTSNLDWGYVSPHDIFQVLNKKTDFISRVNAYLGTKEHVPARDRTRDQTGSCPVCFKNVKLSPRNTIVLHGYTRPGYGQIEGNCPGVGKPPFEISSEGSSDYLRETLEPEILYLKKEIKRLRSGKVTSFAIWLPGGSKTFNIGDPGWDTYLEKKITEEEESLGKFTNLRDVFKTLIQNWKIRPLPKEGEAHIDWFVKGRKSASLRLSAADKYDGIDFKPPKSVADAAAKGLEFREKASPSNKGGLTPAEASKQGIGSGVQRAVNLKNRNNISPDVIRQMVAFFSRHEKNKSIAPENKDTPWNDKGHVAWLIWGGDPGKAWAEKVRDQMDKADERVPTKTAATISEGQKPSARRVARRFVRLASDVAEPPQILRAVHPATLVLRGVADLNQIAPMINRVLPRISLEPASIPKPKTAGKAYNFHWSNAQAAWDVIPVRDYPTTTDGSEFVLFIPKGVHNPVYEGPWTLRDMQVVARNLNPHPGYYGSMESSRGRF